MLLNSSSLMAQIKALPDSSGLWFLKGENEKSYTTCLTSIKKKSQAEINEL